jgi:hypothetical protein
MELAAALTAMLAVEAEPVGLVIVVLVMLLLATRTKDWKLLALKCGAAAAVMAALYLRLHPGAIREMASLPPPPNQYSLGGTLRAYFIERRRHLPELAMFLFGGWLYWTERKKILGRTGVYLAVAVIVMFFLGPHPNVSYMVFAMPFFLWPTLDAYYHARNWRWIPAFVFLGILIQYGYLFHRNLHEGFDGRDFASVQGRIAESANMLQIPDEQVRICGDSSLWFAHPQNYSSCLLAGQGGAIWRANVFLCLDGPLEENGLSSLTWLSCSRLKQQSPLRELSSMEVRGHLLHFYGRQ